MCRLKEFACSQLRPSRSPWSPKAPLAAGPHGLQGALRLGPIAAERLADRNALFGIRCRSCGVLLEVRACK